jgi:hypothetical protein
VVKVTLMWCVTVTSRSSEEMAADVNKSKSSRKYQIAPLHLRETK